MATIINRNTKAIRNSVSTYNKYLNDPNFLVIQCKPLWIDKKLPDCDKKYWKVLDDKVLEMTVLEKKVVDDKITADNQASQLKAEQEVKIQKKQRELAVVPLKESGELPADFESKILNVNEK